MKRFLILWLSLISLAGIALAANVTIVLDGTSVTKPRGSFRQLPDAGFAFTLCYSVNQTDGGRGLAFADCVDCEPGGWNAAPATCQATWKAANGGL